MKKQTVRTWGKIGLYVTLLFFGGVIGVLGRTYQLQAVVMVYFLLLTTMFAGRLSDRVVDGRVRRLLVASAWMMIVFFLLRGMKYYVFREAQGISRFLWYSYYVPILVLAALSVLAAVALDEDRREKILFTAVALGAVTGVLILLILTNDLHQLAFRFMPGFINWDAEYAYGPVYFVTLFWVLLLFLGAVLLLLLKCRLSAARSAIGLPMVPIFLGSTYMVLYALGIPPRWEGGNLIEFPETACFMVACFWECCISIGFIPSNKGYEELFLRSKLAAKIVNADGRTAYASRLAEGAENAGQAGDGGRLNESILRHRREIRGGYVTWQSDVSEVQQLNAKLLEIEEQLSEETELIRLQNKMQEQRAKVDEKNRIYDRIAEGVHAQSQRIAALTREAEENPELYDHHVRRICFYGTYVKRFANLTLLSETTKSISLGELELAMSESLRALCTCGIPVSIQGNLEGEAAGEELLKAYEQFQTMTEQAGDAIKGVTIRFRGRMCKAILEGWDSATNHARKDRITAEKEKGAEASRDQTRAGLWKKTLEDGNLYASLSFERGGEGA